MKRVHVVVKGKPGKVKYLNKWTNKIWCLPEKDLGTTMEC